MQPNIYYRHQPGRSGRTSQGLIPAVAIVAIGALLLLNNLHVVYVDRWYRFWPVLLIGAGVAKLLESNHNGGRVMGGIFAGVGALLLLDNLNYIQLTWDAFWPMVLIGIGILMLFNRLSGPRIIIRRHPDGPITYAEGTFTANAIFSGFKRKITEGDFRGAHL